MMQGIIAMTQPGTCSFSVAFPIRHKYTGKERDSESGLDNFEKRYFGSSLGHFMTPDPPLMDQHIADPQSWNLYSYVRNNPLSFVDPDGNAPMQ